MALPVEGLIGTDDEGVQVRPPSEENASSCTAVPEPNADELLPTRAMLSGA
jgi:hypothetical protein